MTIKHTLANTLIQIGIILALVGSASIDSNMVVAVIVIYVGMGIALAGWMYWRVLKVRGRKKEDARMQRMHGI